MELEEGFYHLKHQGEPEPVVAYFYDCTDAGCKGFGFNIYDGGGFLPLRDLTKETKIVKLKITDSGRVQRGVIAPRLFITEAMVDKGAAIIEEAPLWIDPVDLVLDENPRQIAREIYLAMAIESSVNHLSKAIDAE